MGCTWVFSSSKSLTKGSRTGPGPGIDRWGDRTRSKLKDDETSPPQGSVDPGTVRLTFTSPTVFGE